MTIEKRNPNPSSAASLDEVRRRWGSAVEEGAPEGASIKSSAFLSADAAKAAPSSPGEASAPRRNVATGEPGESPGDFVLGELLGKGGMGLVFRAGQTGLDREVALKTIIPGRAADAEARGKFFAEARVTGQLDHPNIVPIYELASAPDDSLFYTMKEVRGRPWSKALPALSEAENIDILLKVADAVAFAHGKGVIHRDLKPENVMLGDYGEVLLMDWGLAVGVKDGAKAERLSQANARGGTPAYMAPEMAAADPKKIGPASDIYLLGAILYEILTGLRPHTGQNVFGCIAQALLNVIQPSERRDEWMDVARQALATEPAKRFRDVKEFQRAIRDCREHAASLALSKEAGETLKRAKKTGDYTDYARAVFGFGEALRLWPDNGLADMGLAMSRRAYAEAAVKRGDFDLALSQTAHMAAGDAEPLRQRAEAGRAERERRRIRVKRLTQLSAGLAGAVILMGTVAYWRVSRAESRAKADAAAAREAEGEKSKALASEQASRQTAEASRKEAMEAQYRAETALTAKEKAEAKEEAARKEQARLSNELREAAEKLGLWEQTEAAAASLLGVTADEAARGDGETLLAAAIRETGALKAAPDLAARKVKILSAMSMLSRSVPEFASLVGAFDALENEADRAGDQALAAKIHEMSDLLRKRLPRDHLLFERPVLRPSRRADSVDDAAFSDFMDAWAVKHASVGYQHQQRQARIDSRTTLEDLEALGELPNGLRHAVVLGLPEGEGVEAMVRKSLAGMSSLTSLVFYTHGRPVDEGGVIEMISEFRNLESLDAGFFGAQEIDLTPLRQLENLEKIRFFDKTVRKGDMAFFSALPKLRNLDINARASIPGAWAGLATLGGLEILEISGSFAADDVLPSLGELTNLRELTITPGEGVIGQSARSLAKLNKVKQLTLRPIDDGALEHIGKMAGLRELTIEGNISAAGLRRLSGWKKLEEPKYLHLHSTRDIDAAMYRSLRQLPDLNELRIVYERPLLDGDLRELSGIFANTDSTRTLDIEGDFGKTTMEGMKSIARDKLITHLTLRTGNAGDADRLGMMVRELQREKRRMHGKEGVPHAMEASLYAFVIADNRTFTYPYLVDE